MERTAHNYGTLEEGSASRRTEASSPPLTFQKAVIAVISVAGICALLTIGAGPSLIMVSVLLHVFG